MIESDEPDRELELHPDPERVLARTREGAIAPVEVLGDPTTGTVTVMLDGQLLATDAAALLQRRPPAGGYDTQAQWMVAEVARGSGYSPLARYELAFSDKDELVANLAVVFDICEHAEPLDLACHGALVGLALAHRPETVLLTPRVDTAPVSIALRALAAHRLPPPAWRQQPAPLPDRPREKARSRWTKTNSFAGAEREARALSQRQGVATEGDAIFDDAAIAAARAAVALFDQAHPLVIGGQLLNALPDWEEDRHAYQYGLRARLPLPAMYIDLTGKHGDPVRLGETERWSQSRTGPPPIPLHGALCWQEPEHGLAIVPFGVDRRSGPAPEPRLHFQFSRLRSSEFTQARGRRVLYTADDLSVVELNEYLTPALRQHATGLLWMLAGPLMTTILSILYLLESANVELRPAAMYGKAAKRARAASETPASVIHIHSPTSSSTRGPEADGAGKLTERHWRRGSYAHYGEDTRIGAADPTKLSWVPDRGGYYRRVWRRPTIVGPADAPIRFKTRHWTIGPDPRLPQPSEPNDPEGLTSV